MPGVFQYILAMDISGILGRTDTASIPIHYRILPLFAFLLFAHTTLPLPSIPPVRTSCIPHTYFYSSIYHSTPIGYSRKSLIFISHSNILEAIGHVLSVKSG